MSATLPVRKLRTAMDRREHVPVAASVVGAKLGWLVRTGRLGRAVGYLGEFLFDENVYERARDRGPERYAQVDTVVGPMWVDREDPGISRTLFRYGVHERRSTAAFAAALEELSAEVDDAAVLEIGGNIGYFCLLEARHLPDARIYVVEPVEENRRLLERNVAYHGVADRVEVDRSAVAVSNGSARLYLSDCSNQHSLRTATDGGDAVPVADAESVPVRTTTVEGVLAGRGLAPADVNVLRMDLEGYEGVLLPRIRELLTADRPLVVHVELHPPDMSAQERSDVAAVLRESGLAVRSAVTHEGTFGLSDDKSWNGCRVDLDVAELDDWMATATHSLELVLKK